MTIDKLLEYLTDVDLYSQLEKLDEENYCFITLEGVSIRIHFDTETRLIYPLKEQEEYIPIDDEQLMDIIKSQF